MTRVVSVRDIGERVLPEFGTGLLWHDLRGKSQSKSLRWARAVTAYLAADALGSVIGQGEIGAELGRSPCMISQMAARVRDELKYRPTGPIALIVEKCR